MRESWFWGIANAAPQERRVKHLDKAYAGGPETNMKGLLPIPDELLSSFKDSFTKIYDPRESNRHYPLESVLATALMALISGCDSVNSVLKFSTRLSGRQAELLGFPYDEASRQYDLPAYHGYYRMLNRVDYLRVAESLINWLNENMSALPPVLYPNGEVIRDTLYSLDQRFRQWPKPKGRDYELPIGVDPDAPDGLKRDARGNLMD